MVSPFSPNDSLIHIQLFRYKTLMSLKSGTKLDVNGDFEPKIRFFLWVYERILLQQRCNDIVEPYVKHFEALSAF